MAGVSSASAAPDALVDIVVVNWNAGSLLSECVTALDRSTIARALRVVVVDNASTDHSIQALATQRLQLDVILNSENRGFAAACNQGARLGAAPYLLFLNPDVEVHTDAVEKALAYLSSPAHERTGIVGIQLLSRDGTVSRCCARTPSLSGLLLRTMFLDRICPRLVKPHFLEDWDHTDTRPVDQVMGAFLLIRRGLFEKLGFFDERFFVYYEDVDLCLSARQAGWSVVHVADAKARHAMGGTTRAIRDVRLSLLLESRVAFAAKRYGRAAATALTLAILACELPIRLLHATLTDREPRWIVRAMVIYCRSLMRRGGGIVAHDP
ncbi:MAG: glycosyltransferase family 2 protein [Xanthobacteraceae bacterium]